MESELVCYDNDCCCDMPMGVLNQILLYLQVNSLVRFTCVCKSLLQLIREVQFAIKHYLLRSSKQSKYLVDYFANYGRRCGSITGEEVLRCCMYSLTVKREFGHGLKVSVSNFCHGILCVLLRASARDAKFLLCNPAIREVVPIPVSINTVTNGESKFGLGFDPTNNDYKILAIHPPEILSHWLVDVYYVRSGSWHNVQAIAALDKFSNLDLEPTLNNNGRILNWLGYCESNAEKSLVSFDMIDEVFKETSLPECYPNSWREHHLLSSSHFQALICCSLFPCFDLIEGNAFFNSIDIWVLNGSMWSKHVSFRFPDPEMLVWSMDIWMNDEELFVYVNKKKGGVWEGCSIMILTPKSSSERGNLGLL